MLAVVRRRSRLALLVVEGIDVDRVLDVGMVCVIYWLSGMSVVWNT
jgi:hypothetical protein